MKKKYGIRLDFENVEFTNKFEFEKQEPKNVAEGLGITNLMENFKIEEINLGSDSSDAEIVLVGEISDKAINEYGSRGNVLSELKDNEFIAKVVKLD